jgi:hypothetical protein
MIRVLKKETIFNNETFTQSLRVTLEIDLNLELQQDVSVMNLSDEAEIHRKLGSEIFKTIKETRNV